MARRKKYKIEEFPAPGSVFAMPLKDGRFGICRVLQLQLDRKGYPEALVAASNWIGEAPPALTNPAVKRTLMLTHHSLGDDPERLWVSDLPPKKFIKLGQIKLSKKDKEAKGNSYSGWEHLPLQVLLQWRWDHDREALLREDEQEKAAKEKEYAKAASTREDYLSKVTLPQLLSKKLFPTWNGYQKPNDTKAVEQIVKSFLQTLADIRGPLTRDLVTQELKSCIEKLNTFDQKRHMIETVEREDLFDVFEEILHAAKQPDLLAVVEDVRDW
jgi:hypothetical protein